MGLVVPFKVQWYNTAVAASGHPEWVLPCFGRAHTLGLLIGNTRDMWPALKAHANADPSNWIGEHVRPDPVDDFAALAVGAAAKALQAATGTAPATRFSQDMETDKFVHMQLLASICGLTHKDNHSMLSIHETFGPWLSLRAAVCLDADAPLGLDQPDPIPHPNPRSVPLIKAHMEAILEPGHTAGWRDWLRGRDIVGDFDPARAHRFSEDQLAYHYTKHYDLLRQ